MTFAGSWKGRARIREQEQQSLENESENLQVTLQKPISLSMPDVFYSSSEIRRHPGDKTLKMQGRWSLHEDMKCPRGKPGPPGMDGEDGGRVRCVCELKLKIPLYGVLREMPMNSYLQNCIAIYGHKTERSFRVIGITTHKTSYSERRLSYKLLVIKFDCII